MAGKKLKEYVEEWSCTPWDEHEIFWHIKELVDPQEEIVPHINRYFREHEVILKLLRENGYEFG